MNGYQDHLVLDFSQVSPSWLFPGYGATGVELTLTEGSRTLTFTGYEVLDIFYGDDNDELWTTRDYPYDNSRIGVIDTGAGDDSVGYSSTGGTILTGEGNDWVSLDNHVFGATVDLGEGDDEVRSVAQQCRIFGRGGNDTIDGNGTEWMDGGAGNDLLRFGKMMLGGAGNDVFEISNDFAVSAYGGSGNDRMLSAGGRGTRTLDGGSGDDYILAPIGVDGSISGGAGRDAIEVSINDRSGLHSRVDGGAGDDLIGIGYWRESGPILTEVLGGAGNDLILFSNRPGDSTLALLPGAKVDGGAGKDLIGGSVTSDTLKGGAGDDYISDDGFGSAWNLEATYNTSDMLAVLSTITKGAGGGNDVLIGGLGNDTLSGGLGMDKLIGGAGQDRFLFETAPALYNTDRVVDFVSGEDKLLLDATIYTALGLSGTSAGEALPETLFRTGHKAITAEQRLIFNVNTHLLSYDADGNGSGEAVPIAIIAGQSLSLHASDFLIV